MPNEEAFKAFQEKAEGTNINPRTLLATDYLNHFNEIIMLIEMVPDMPDILEEAKEWQPKSYQEHFGDSTFSDKDLAVEAYDHVPPKYREKFETTIQQMDSVILTGITQIEETVAMGDPDFIRIRVQGIVSLLHQLGDVAGGIIHGSESTLDQGEIDAVMGGEDDVQGQAASDRAGLQDQLDNLMSWATSDTVAEATENAAAEGDLPSLAEIEVRLRVELDDVDGAAPISGGVAPSSQADIDALFDSPTPASTAPSTQADIDALFDAPSPPEDEKPTEETDKKTDTVNQADIDALFD